jgi:hypothetical protein
MAMFYRLIESSLSTSGAQIMYAALLIAVDTSVGEVGSQAANQLYQA